MITKLGKRLNRKVLLSSLGALIVGVGAWGYISYAATVTGNFVQDVKATLSIVDKVNGAEKTEYFSGETINLSSILEASGNGSTYESPYVLVKIPAEYLNTYNIVNTSAILTRSQFDSNGYKVARLDLRDISGGSFVGLDFNFTLKDYETPEGYKAEVIIEYYSKDNVILSRQAKEISTIKAQKGITTSKAIQYGGTTTTQTKDINVVTYTDETNTTIDKNSWSTMGIIRYSLNAKSTNTGLKTGRNSVKEFTFTDRIPEYLELTQASLNDGWVFDPNTRIATKTVPAVGDKKDESFVALELVYSKDTPESILGKEVKNTASIGAVYSDGEIFSNESSVSFIPKAMRKISGNVYTFSKSLDRQYGVTSRQINNNTVYNLAYYKTPSADITWVATLNIKNLGLDTVPVKEFRDDFSDYYNLKRIQLQSNYSKFNDDDAWEVYVTNSQGVEMKIGELTTGSGVDVTQSDIVSARVVSKRGTVPGYISSSTASYNISLQYIVEADTARMQKESMNNYNNFPNTAYAVIDDATTMVSTGNFYGEYKEAILNNNIALNNKTYAYNQLLATSGTFWFIGSGHRINRYDLSSFEDGKLIYLFPQEMELSEGGTNKVLDGRWEYIYNYKNTGKSAVIMHQDFETVGFLKVGRLMASGSYEVEMVTIWNENDTYRHGDASDDLDFHNDGVTSRNVARSKGAFTVSNPILVTTHKQVRIANENGFWSESVQRAKAGDNIEYRLSLINYNNTEISNAQILDILPYENDKSIVRNNSGQLVSRGSTINVQLTGPVADESGKFDVYYSTEEPGANENESYAKNFVPASQITDWSQVRMIKIEQKSGTLISVQSTASFRVPAKVSENATDLSKAVNSFATRMNNLQNFVEGNTATVNVEYPASVSGVAFQDKNSNSVYDSGDTLLKSYTVQLYNTDGTPVAGKTATTDDNGFYKIETYDLKKYYVQFARNDTLPVVPDRTVQENGKIISTKDVLNGSNITDRQALKSTEFTLSKNAGERSAVRNIGVYEPTGTVKVKYQTEDGRALSQDIVLAQDAPLGGSYNAESSKWPDIIDNNLVYVFLKVKDGSAPVFGNIIEGEQSVIYIYAPKPGSQVSAQYLIALTQKELLPVRTVSPAGTQVGTPYSASKDQELTDQNGLVYVFSALRAGSAQETGRVTEAAQTVTFDYAPKAGGSVVAKFLLEDDTEISTQETIKAAGTQVGTTYSSSPKNEIVYGGITYVYSKVTADSAQQIGRVDTSNKAIKYVYAPKRGGQVVANFVDEQGNSIAQTKIVAQNGTPVGTSYTDQTPPNEITNGAGLKFTFKEWRATSVPKAGVVKEQTQEIVYVYLKKSGEGVTSKFVNENGDEIANSETVITTGAQVGTPYNASNPNEITDKDGLVYTFEKLADNSAKETGKSSEAAQTVIFQYKKKEGGEVVAKFLDQDGNELKNEEEVLPAGTQVGTKYESKNDNEIEKDGLVYIFEKLDDASAPESGRVTVDKQTVVYRYAPKKGGTVIAKFVDENGNEIQSSQIISKAGTQVGTPYESTTVKKISINGKNYILRKINGQEKGKVVEGETVVEYIFELEKSDILSPNTGFSQPMNIIMLIIAILGAFAYIVVKKQNLV